ncbi:MAG: GldM family protein [Bacteroidota bacterium]
MINIMYLVLMALLALNVSAEVMNAFETLDKGNKSSIALVDKQVSESETGLEKLIQDAEGSKDNFKPLIPAIKDIRATVADFNSYVSGIGSTLVDMAGDNNGQDDEGDYKDGHIRGKKNKDVTTRFLVLGDDGAGGNPGEGETLKQRIIDTRQALIDRYRQLLTEHGSEMEIKPEEIDAKVAALDANIPFNVDDETWKNADKKKESWSEFKFGHMPVAAVMPLLSQMQSDLKISEANIVNELVNIAGGKNIVIDEFFPVLNADKSYVIGGESINAEVSVGSYSSSLDPSNVKLYVGGQQLTIGPDGKAKYTIRGSGQGPKTISTRVEVRNPLTGEIKTGEGQFTYEVGARSVAVAADKMNVFYMGVDNPITVSAAGVASGDVRVNVTGDARRKSGSGSKFIIEGTKQGDAKVTVTANGQTLGSFDFRVKRIPDPVAKVGGSRGGDIRASTFKAQQGLYAELEAFDFEARCIISGFELVYAPKGRDAVPSVNAGGNFTESTKKLVRLVKPGDNVYINNIKARCPGDQGPRPLGTMAFKII